LRTKINIILLAVLIVFLGIGLTWEYRQQRSLFFLKQLTRRRLLPRKRPEPASTFQNNSRLVVLN